MNETYEKCNICKATHTMLRVWFAPENSVYICSECIKKAKDAFICNYVPWQQKALKEIAWYANIKYKRGTK